MGRYTTQQLVLIIEHCFKNNESMVVVVQKFYTKHDRNSVLTS